jgi:four helix bundle protein
MFDHERLDAYRLALEFDRTVAGFRPSRGHRSLREQIDRASTGILACIAEGAGRRSPPDKRRFYGMARASATECVAHLDALTNRKLLTTDEYSTARALLFRLVQILSRLSDPSPPSRAPERERERCP